MILAISFTIYFLHWNLSLWPPWRFEDLLMWTLFPGAICIFYIMNRPLRWVHLLRTHLHRSQGVYISKVSLCMYLFETSPFLPYLTYQFLTIASKWGMVLQNMWRRVVGDVMKNISPWNIFPTLLLPAIFINFLKLLLADGDWWSLSPANFMN